MSSSSTLFYVFKLHVTDFWLHHDYSESTSLYLLLQPLILRVGTGTPSYEEPKFIVFFSMFLSLFTMVCFKCKKSEPTATMKQRGPMVVVSQHCTTCGDNAFSWRSQPLIFGKYPAGNMLLSFGVLMAGASISKVLLVMRHMGLCGYSARTFPVILNYWEQYRACLLYTSPSPRDA